MLDTFPLDDPAAIRRVVDTYGWATLISEGADGPVVSHLPVVLDPDDEQLTVLGHLAATDAELHELGRRRAVVVIQGPHGYVSPTLYAPHGPYVSTWNFVVVHLHGTPELLDADATWTLLDRTVDHAERRFETPWHMDSVRDYAQSLLPHVAGFRLRPERVVAKAKMSQDKPAAVVRQLVDAFSGHGEYADAQLATAMREFGPA